MNSQPAPLPEMTQPSMGSTLAFLGVVAMVYVAFVAAFAWSARRSDAPRRLPLFAASILGAWMLLTAGAAEFGLLATLANSPKLAAYLLMANGLAVALALSPLGRRLATELPIAALVLFHGFRLPLELVLHQWFEEGVLPVQMTYSGHNFDIVTGVLALVLGGFLVWGRPSLAVRRVLAHGFNFVGFALLLTVVSIAMRSTPWPLRSYENDPPILLVFHAPYTWILPICVAGAFCGHILLFRALRLQSALTQAP